MSKIAVVGASGYVGAELVRILLAHPRVEDIIVTSAHHAGQDLADLYPNLPSGKLILQPSSDLEKIKEQVDAAFVALPHGSSAATVSLFYLSNKRVIDMSADFRLPVSLYQKWYNRNHPKPQLINKAVYGLTELNRQEIAQAKLIANPGCYATSILVAIIPLVSQNLATEKFYVSSISGSSGAGRGLSDMLHFSNLEGNLIAYKTGGKHHHIPEIEQAIKDKFNSEIEMVFIPHLGSFVRGIFTTVYMSTKETISSDKLFEIYSQFYKDEIFVRIFKEKSPELKAVIGTNNCHLSVVYDEHAGSVVILSAIDNLIKGAAGQAIQNFNLMFGYPETEGLKNLACYP
jgi:N-acetyl-gamma-glutamyl-phosphate reductase